jgi:TPR repeat protein
MKISELLKLVSAFAGIVVLHLATASFALAETYKDALLAYETGDLATALRLYRSLAERGDIRAQQGLGRMYARGEGVERNPAEASKWFHKASDARNALKAYNSGDFAAALRVFRPMADQGQVLGEYILGLMYANGQGMPEDYAEALKWLQKAADKGETKAQFSVGVIYFKGLGIPKNYAEASKWYQRAADQGNAAAQFNLGQMYNRGQGVTANPVTAYMLFELAAANGIKAAVEARDNLTKSLSPAQILDAQKLAHDWKPKSEL